MHDSIFKAYDIRGIYPTEIDEDAAYRIAQAYAKFIGPRAVVLGRDVRLSSPALAEAAGRGLTDHGIVVRDIGVATSEMIYFATAFCGADGGLMITASHNPREWNGMKLMRRGAAPISEESGIRDIQALAREGYALRAPRKGNSEPLDITDAYLAKCLSFIDAAAIEPLTVVANGMFGPVCALLKRLPLPIRWMFLNDEPDGSFPKGPPNPLLPENQRETVELVRRSGADFGAAWDGDADRFFLFDETGRPVPGYYLTAFFGARFSRKHPGAKIVHDARLVWAVRDAVRSAGGVPLANRAGQSLIKERMRKEQAVFAGEMSGHFYFRDFFYSDSGLIAFLVVLEAVSRAKRKTSDIFAPYFEQYFISGEINMPIGSGADTAAVLARVEAKYADAKLERTDGLSVEYPGWRANVRPSNTEPLLRVNVEARDEAVMRRKTEEILALVRGGEAR